MRRSEVLAAEAVSCLNKALILLRDVWEQIGISEPQRLERTTTVKKHVQGLLEMMIAEEEALKLRLEKSVQTSRAEIQQLRRELELPQTQEEPRPLLQEEAELRRLVERLKEERRLRMERLHLLLKEDLHQSSILGTLTFNIDKTRPPSAWQLDQLHQHLANQRQEKEQREVQLRSLRDQILVLFSDLDHSPDSDLEQNLVQTGLDKICLSLENLETLEQLRIQLEGQREDLEDQTKLIQDQIQTLWNRLETDQDQQEAFIRSLPQGRVRERLRLLQCEAEHLQKVKMKRMTSLKDKVKTEISLFWDKCFCSDDNRLGLAVYCSDQVSDKVLEALEAELKRLKQFYENHRPIIEGVQRWINQWELFLELEKKASDPSRFLNRGGNLLREERQRTELSRSLTKLERELKNQISFWEETRKQRFFVKGLDFPEFVEQQWSLFQQQKETERNQRLLKKARQTEEDMKYGTTVRTPTKRRFISTNSPTRAFIKSPSPGCSLQTTRSNWSRRTPLNGCSLSINSSLRSPKPRPPQVPLVRTPTRSKPPQPRGLALNQAQPRTRPGLDQDQVWSQAQKENIPQAPEKAPEEAQTLGSVASTYSDFLRDLSQSNGKEQNQVLNSTDL